MTRVLCSGSFICDLIAADLPGLGNPGDLIYPPGGIRLHPGGHSANVAIDLAQLGHRDTAVVGGIGDDVLGDYIESELTRRGLQAYPERIPEAHTAKNLVLIVKGEDRRFYAELSANTLLTPGHVMKTLNQTRPEVLYQGTVGGLKLIDNEIGAVLSEAKARGVVTVLDVVRPRGATDDVDAGSGGASAELILKALGRRPEARALVCFAGLPSISSTCFTATDTRLKSSQERRTR